MKVMIGFEIHEQLKTQQKLFCECSTDYMHAEPNTNVCEICTGMPGAKPMPLNEKALDAVIAIALMLNCDIKREVYIQRKHYDYPDLPNGYQRTSTPIGVDGELAGVRIWEVHLEEDPGKYDPITGRVDYNRCGVPLVEIVTAPDITSAEHARDFLKELRRVLEYTGVIREEGGTMRVDVNISIEGGARVEIKNINSIKGVYRAIKFEIARQQNLIKRGIKVKRETRAFIEEQMITKAMRTKEEAQDYRYIPDPDLLPIFITQERIERIKQTLPESPFEKEKRFVRQYGIDSETAKVLASELELANAFEEVAKHVDAKIAALWIKDELKRILNYNDITFKQSGIKAEHIVELIKMMEKKEITQKTAKKIMEVLVKNPKSPREIVKELGLSRLADKEALEKIVEEAINENRKAVEDYLNGKKEALNFIVGAVMRKTRGRADAKIVLELIKSKISA